MLSFYVFFIHIISILLLLQCFFLFSIIMIYFFSYKKIFFVINFLSSILYIFPLWWKFKELLKYFLLDFLKNFPFSILLFENNNLILSNSQNIFNIKTLKELIESFSQYIDKEKLEDFFLEKQGAKDLIIGDYFWHMELRSFNDYKLLFFYENKNNLANLIDESLKEYILKTEKALLLVEKEQIVFVNNSCKKIFNMQLIGKEITDFPDLLKSPKEFKINSKIFNINICNTKSLQLYEFVPQTHPFCEFLLELPLKVLLLDKKNNIIAASKLAQNINLNRDIALENKDYFFNYLEQLQLGKFLNPILINLAKQPVDVYSKIINNFLLLIFMETNTKDFQLFLHKQRLDALGGIVGSISHDFNNSLTTVLALIDMVSEKNKLEELSQIKKSIDQAVKLSKKMTRLAANLPLQEKIINVNEVVKNSNETLFRVLTNNNNITTTIQYTPKPAFVLMQEISLEQILTNLIINSRDAMPYGGTINITIDVIKLEKYSIKNGYYINAGDYVELTVSDSGCGIKPEDLHRVFEPFFTTKKDKGSGIGLNTVQSIVQKKGGFINLKSKENVGTILTIYLPAVKNKIENIEEDKDQKTILFVEDEKIILSSISGSLRNNGFKVIESNNAEEVLQNFQNNDFIQNIPEIDLLILDINLRTMNGFELYEKLKLKRQNLKVLFISGYAQKFEENDEKFYLEKPFSFPEILAKINFIFNKIKLIN